MTDSFTPISGDDTQFTEDGMPVARVNPDPATLDKLTLPHLPDGDDDAEMIPTALAQIDRREKHVREEMLATKAANLDGNDRPHFLRNIDGREVCGQDGDPWPCDTYRTMLADDQQGHAVSSAADTPHVLEELLARHAEQAGISQEQLLANLLERRQQLDAGL